VCGVCVDKQANNSLSKLTARTSVPLLPPRHYQTVQCTVHKSRDDQLLDGGA